MLGPMSDATGTTDAAVDLAEPLGFTCPRCRLEVQEQFYGPCTSCRTTLRATVGGEARDVEDVAYEPKMNVTPNAVALKD
jgi:hypothetical protein